MADRRSTADPARSAAPAEQAQRPGHRLTLRVPAADTSVTGWWKAQDDPSASVRHLIRDEIMRHGFSDTANRPVSQLPRRGRPSFAEMALEAQDADAEADAFPEDVQVSGRGRGTAEVLVTGWQTPLVVSDSKRGLAAEPDALPGDVASRPEAAAEPGQAPAPDGPDDLAEPPGQVDMDAIFGH